MLNDYYPPFHELSVDSKIALLECAHSSINIFNTAYLTSQVFPDASDTRYVLASGYYMDIARIYEYVKGAFPAADAEEHTRIKLMLMREFRALATKVAKANVRLIDTAALLCLALWTEAEHKGMLIESMTEHKDAVIAEWSQELCATYGPDIACRQTAKMMNLLVDLREATSKIQDTFIITKVLKPAEISACEQTHLLKDNALNLLRARIQ